GRPFAAAGDRGELPPAPPAPSQQRPEPLFVFFPPPHAAPRPPFRILGPLAELGEVDSGDPCAQAGDLPSQLLGALRRGRLQRERPEPLRHLSLQVARALDLLRDPRQLELGAMPPALEATEPP